MVNKNLPQGQAEAFQTLGLNLLSGFRDILSTPRKIEENIKRYKKLILVLSVVFGFLLIFNYVLDARLDFLKGEQEILTLKVLRYFQVEKDSKSIYERTSYYLRKQSEKEKTFDKTTFVMQNMDGGAELTRLRMDENSFVIDIKGKNAFVFTKTISNYLSGDLISEMILKSASFNSRTEEFKVEMEGVFTR